MTSSSFIDRSPLQYSGVIKVPHCKNISNKTKTCSYAMTYDWLSEEFRSAFFDEINNAVSEIPPVIKIFVTVVFAFIANAFLTTLQKQSEKRKKLPPFYSESPYIPWLGSLWQFATGPREFLQRAATKHGDCFRIQLFGKNMVFLTGSDGHAAFFKAPEKVFDIREAYAMTVTTFGPDVCYDCPQRKMAEQFAFFKDGLSDAKFVEYMKIVQEEVAEFFENEWGDEGEADLLESLSNVFTLTSSRCLLGEEVKKRWKKSGMAEAYISLDHSFVPILFFFPNIPNPNKSKCVAARDLFTKIFTEIIDERNKEKKEKPSYTPPQDFLQVLMDASYRDGKKLTTGEITGIMIGVLLGGQHTSNVTGTWLMSHLLKDEEWKTNIMEEQKKIFAKKSDSEKEGLYPAQLTYDEVQNMPIFDQVLSETLRLHPPFFQLSRSVKKDTPFQDYVIPEGSFVNISPGAAHRLTSLWGEEAESFDPDRFTADAKKEHKPYSWIPFGGGMHQCGGRKFAWNSLKVSLTWLLRNYELEFVGAGAESSPLEDYTTMVVAPTNKHCVVKYKRRRA